MGKTDVEQGKHHGGKGLDADDKAQIKKMQEIGHNAMSFGASRLLDCCQAVSFNHAQATPAHVAKTIASA